MKKYGVVLWYDNLEKIKEYIESIAKNEFKETKLILELKLFLIPFFIIKGTRLL